jgi:hypothetical protein
LFVVAAVAGLIISLAGPILAHDEKKPGGKIERSMSVDPQATLTLCVASGELKVRGWDKNEVHVRSVDAAQLDFRRIDRIKDSSKPATRVDVMVFDKSGLSNPKLDCQAVADVEMDVPAGATVQVQTRDGDIIISGVSGAYAGSQNGDITIERAAKLVEAGSVGGSIYLRDSSGRVNLSSAGGGVEVVNVRPATEEDTFEVGTVSGDIHLDRVSNPKVLAKTVNGAVMMTGPLAKSGYYGFTNVTGDVVLALPHDASFKLNAKVSDKHDIVSDFKLIYLSEPPPPPGAKPRSPEAKPKTPAPTPKGDPTQPPQKTGPVVGAIIVGRPAPVGVQYALRRVNAIYGSGDATISIATFGGSIRIKKI